MSSRHLLLLLLLLLPLFTATAAEAAVILTDVKITPTTVDVALAPASVTVAVSVLVDTPNAVFERAEVGLEGRAPTRRWVLLNRGTWNSAEGGRKTGEWVFEAWVVDVGLTDTWDVAYVYLADSQSASNNYTTEDLIRKGFPSSILAKNSASMCKNAEDCSYHGICASSGLCHCDFGWAGTACDQTDPALSEVNAVLVIMYSLVLLSIVFCLVYCVHHVRHQWQARNEAPPLALKAINVDAGSREAAAEPRAGVGAGSLREQNANSQRSRGARSGSRNGRRGRPNAATFSVEDELDNAIADRDDDGNEDAPLVRITPPPIPILAAAGPPELSATSTPQQDIDSLLS